MNFNRLRSSNRLYFRFIICREKHNLTSYCEHCQNRVHSPELHLRRRTKTDTKTNVMNICFGSVHLTRSSRSRDCCSFIAGRERRVYRQSPKQQFIRKPHLDMLCRRRLLVDRRKQCLRLDCILNVFN